MDALRYDWAAALVIWATVIILTSRNLISQHLSLSAFQSFQPFSLSAFQLFSFSAFLRYP